MKRSFLSFAIIMIVSCLITSCTVYKTSRVSMLSDYTTEFVGKPHNHIVATLGAPDRQTSDGAGGTILIYEETTMTSTSNSVAAAYNVNYFTKTYTPGTRTSTNTTEHTSYIHLFIDKDGECYAVKTNHEKDVTQVDEKATKRVKKFWKIYGITFGSLLGVSFALLGISALM